MLLGQAAPLLIVVKVQPLLDAARLLHDLQQVNQIVQSLSGNLDAEAIAQQVTDALTAEFDCVLARIWLVESDRTALRLVASSGLYTRTNGSFARVPMGAYKVGKIAQNQVPFLSNQLPEESWVKDRQWAIDHQICGFAGYPLIARNQSLGVLAAFSHQPFAPEFLEVLQVLCMTLAVALAAMTCKTLSATQPLRPANHAHLPLSDRMANVLANARLLLVGTEPPLPTSLTCVFLQAAEIFATLDCRYCRLTYTAEGVVLEAIVVADAEAASEASVCQALVAARSPLADLKLLVNCLGGRLQSEPVMAGDACQVSLELPYIPHALDQPVRVQCRQPLLQTAFTQLAYRAGLTVCNPNTPAVLAIADEAVMPDRLPTIWVRHDQQPAPEGVAAVADLTTTPAQLRHYAEQALQGKRVQPECAEQPLSEREQQVMRLLAEGKRDRNIAQELYISESTVKFHINNSLAKLKAKNRYQGVYQAGIRGWI